MSKMSKKAKVEQYDKVARERDIYLRLAHILLSRDEADGWTWFKHDGYRYEYRLYDSLRAAGGIVTMTMREIGETRVSVTAEYFDDWTRKVAELPYGVGTTTEIKIAAEKLTAVRRELFDAELAKLTR